MPGGGKQPGAGRPKGSLSKRTIAVKEAIELAFKGLGGVPSLIKWAKTNPDTFYGTVWPKILPRDLRVTVDVTLRQQIVEQTTTLWLKREQAVEQAAELEYAKERASED